jgi:hypothetical protein
MKARPATDYGKRAPHHRDVRERVTNIFADNRPQALTARLIRFTPAKRPLVEAHEMDELIFSSATPRHVDHLRTIGLSPAFLTLLK